MTDLTRRPDRDAVVSPRAPEYRAPVGPRGSRAAQTEVALRPAATRGLVRRALVVAALVTGALALWMPAAVAQATGTPPAPTQVAPIGGITTTTTPTYTWNAAGSGGTVAASYRLYVTRYVNNAWTGVIDQLYPGPQAGCAAGGRCTATPTTALARGTYAWYVAAYNAAGWSPWSSGLGFTIGAPPPKPSLVAPYSAGSWDAITTTTPTYSWNAAGTGLARATDYELWIQIESNGTKRLVLDKIISAADAGCATAAQCRVVGPTGGPGSHTWFVRAGNASGWSDWSAGMGFWRR